MHRGVGTVALAVWLSGCASTYVAKTAPARAAYVRGDYDAALAKYAAVMPQEKNSINQLLILLDRGMVAHAAGRWQESIDILTQADELSKKLDFTSVSEEAAALITNEGTRVYRGEDFEKLMITMLLAVNYYQLGKDEDALVEVRRVNERIEKMIAEEKKPYEQLGVARYMAGVFWEDTRELDNAALDYLKAAEAEKNIGSAVEAALRLAKKTERDDQYNALKKKFPNVTIEEVGRGDSQVVVLIEAGMAPEKHSSDRQVAGNDGRVGTMIAVPVYPPRAVPIPRAKVMLDGKVIEAGTVTSVDRVANVHLNDRIGKLIAKSAASLLLKAGVAGAVGAAAKSEALGAATFLLLSMTQQADLRSWTTLPAEFQVARKRVAPGTYKFTVEYGGRTTNHEVTVKPGRVALAVVRRF